jgi:CarboxypepD_reg-like domain/TonB-dependent Receptor Plug Domain
MIYKIYAAVIIIITAGGFAMGQTGTLKGKAIDETTGEGISFANVQLEQNGNAVGKTVADINGDFTIKPIPPGSYDVKVASVGYQTYFTKGVIVGGDKTVYVEAKVKSTAIEKEAFVVTEYVKPLIDPDTKSGGTVTREEFQAMPSKNINSVASTTAGVFQRDENSELSVRGGRPTTKEDQTLGSTEYTIESSTKYMIDGNLVRGTYGLPQGAIEQVSVITGGIPAQYGDATGGIISITTRGGILPTYYGGGELVSSRLTDAYDYNFAALNLGGPVFFKKDSLGNKQPKMGFSISGEVTSEKDPDPSAVGIYKVKDEKLKELQKSPLSVSETGGPALSAEYLRTDDLEHIKARQNVQAKTAKVAGKIDFKASNSIQFTLGGSMDYGNSHDFQYDYSLLNPGNNPQNLHNTLRAYAKITQKIGNHSGTGNSSSLIQNAYYTLQAAYTKYNEVQQDDSHKDNFFNYGYVGKFKTYKAPTFSKVTGANGNIYYEQNAAPSDTAVTFDPSNSPNPEGALYTSQYYDLVPGNPKTLTDIQSGLGIRNGDRPNSPYNLWYNTGRQWNGYHNIDQQQVRFTGSFSADIKNHAVQLGFEYEKRDDRLSQVAPIPLWTQMRQLTNKQITQINLADSSLYTSNYNGTGFAAYTHPYKFIESEQSQFDKSLRAKLNIAKDEWVDIDSYDPAIFSLSMFSPDELLTPSLVKYYGYSYDGKRLSGKQGLTLNSLKAFYQGKDVNGNFSRIIPSFQPVYTSGYIQDKFDIKDVKFNIGLRLDRFDANQPVLQDKYLLYEARTVSDGLLFNTPGYSIPSNMGSDYVVYVDDIKNPTKVLGYRHGDQWYNKDGTAISSPNTITSKAGIQPYLKYPGEQNLLDSSDINKVFKMYVPQLSIMPRIAFSFPISDKANFFAHYDVLTERPPGYLRFDPTSYQPNNIPTSTSPANNPALKPERTTDYEVGFTQTISERKNAALTLSAFYREMRDMVQVITVYGAYPNTYSTFGNIDFGTVKGLTVAYDLRRTNNVRMTASYTLQFADGTGSAANTAKNIISSDQPNLRTTMPLDFDQRHSIVVNLDYRFGSGKNYTGPRADWARIIFENFGGNIVFRSASGLPYSRQKKVSSGNGNGGNQVIFSQNDPTALKGKINGSNLPWQNRADLRLDKNITLNWKKAEGEAKGKSSNLNIYVQVLNILNSKNVLNLYRYTGDPTNDGYIDAPANQNSINDRLSPGSFRDLYSAKIANPSFFSIPRRIRLGLTLDF